jgi:hypothetical protein
MWVTILGANQAPKGFDIVNIELVRQPPSSRVFIKAEFEGSRDWLIEIQITH